MLSSDDKNEIREIVTASVTAAVASVIGPSGAGIPCCAERCQERCGITPVEHAQHHEDFEAFLNFMRGAGRTAMNTTVRAALAGLGLLLLFGFYYWFKKIQ